MTKLSREQLGVKKDDMIIMEGIVSFARTGTLIEGEALIAENKRREGLGMMKSDKPFRSISITQPKIIKGEGTPLATYYEQRAYKDKAGNISVSLESKSQFAPKYGHIQNGVLVEMPDPQKNPAPGQKVMLFINAYGSKSFSKLGSSFNAIVFPEGEIKYYEAGNGGGGGLSGFGEALNIPVQNMSGQAPEPANMLGQAPTTAPAFGASAPAENNGGGFGEAAVQAPTQPVQPTVDNGFAGFGQTPAEPVTSGRSSNPFA